MQVFNRTLSARYVVWALAALVAWVPRVRAQQAVAGPLPIDVSVTPPKVMLGGTVTIKGTSGLLGGTKVVTLKVAGPNAAASATLSAQGGASGAYTTVFAKTGALGKYTVTATAPDGKGTATASFTVVGPAEIPAAVARKADSLALLATQVAAVVRKGIDAMQASPAREQARSKVVQAEAQVAKLPAQVAVLRQQMSKGFEARAKVQQPIPEWDTYVGELAQWQDDADAARRKLEEAAQPTAAGTEGCGDLERYNEMLTFTSEALNLVKAPFDLTGSFFSDKIPAGLVARSGASQITPAERFALVQTMKLSAAAIQGPAATAAAVPGFMVDAAQFLLQAGFDKYCVKWEGPLKGTFLGESFTKQGEAFFDYTVDLEGKLMLLYAKGAPKGVPVKLSGYLEGTGRFDVRDNPKPIARLVPGQVLFHRVFSPPGGSFWDELGQANRSLLPHSFRIPLSGIMAGDSILLTLEPAAHDFGPTIKGMSTWVVLPLGGLVPQVINSPIDLQKAHPMIERVIRRRPVLRITSSGATMIAQGAFSRDTTNSDKTARVRTTLSIRACNPGCVPLPLTPGAK